MIGWVDNELKMWRKWAGRQLSMGFNSRTILSKMIDFGVLIGVASYDSSPAIDFNYECEQIDKAINQLSKSDIEIIMLYYCNPRTVIEKAKAIGVSKSIFYDRLHQVHVKLEQTLTDRTF